MMHQWSIINQMAEEAKDGSAMQNAIPREAPHNFYQQSELIELMNK